MAEDNMNYGLFSDKENTDVDLDIRTEIYFSQKDHPEGKMVPILVESKEVFILIPLDIKDGTVIKIDGKGKYNQRLGKSGDLYVLVHIEERPFPLKLILIVIAVIAAVTAVALLLSKKPESKPQSTSEPIATSCVHSWIPADCITPKTCSQCGETIGKTTTHEWIETTYIAPQTCIVCGETLGHPLGKPISIENDYVVALRTDGTVLAAGMNNYGECDVATWENIIAVDTSGSHTVGLRADGTVVAVGYNYSGQCNVADWTDIVMITTTYDCTVGLCNDGTVVVTGNDPMNELDVSEWSDIVSIAADTQHIYGVKSDGSVVVAGPNDYMQYVSGWTEIIAISADDSNVIGLRVDGTVVAIGENWAGGCNVGTWENIVAVDTAAGLTFGLRSDGRIEMSSVESSDSMSQYSNTSTSNPTPNKTIISDDAVPLMSIAMPIEIESLRSEIISLSDIAMFSVSRNNLIALQKNGDIVIIGEIYGIDRTDVMHWDGIGASPADLFAMSKSNSHEDANIDGMLNNMLHHSNTLVFSDIPDIFYTSINEMGTFLCADLGTMNHQSRDVSGHYGIKVNGINQDINYQLALDTYRQENAISAEGKPFRISFDIPKNEQYPLKVNLYTIGSNSISSYQTAGWKGIKLGDSVEEVCKKLGLDANLLSAYSTITLTITTSTQSTTCAVSMNSDEEKPESKVIAVRFKDGNSIRWATEYRITLEFEDVNHLSSVKYYDYGKLLALTYPEE